MWQTKKPHPQIIQHPQILHIYHIIAKDTSNINDVTAKDTSPTNYTTSTNTSHICHRIAKDTSNINYVAVKDTNHLTVTNTLHIDHRTATYTSNINPFTAKDNSHSKYLAVYTYSLGMRVKVLLPEYKVKSVLLYWTTVQLKILNCRPFSDAFLVYFISAF